MIDMETALGIVGIVGAISGAVFAAYKLRPESARVFVDSAKVTVEIADEARDNLREDVAALRDELAERKREEAEYRRDVEARLAELGAELRAAKGEKQVLLDENRRLRQRVSDLEAEVERLKTARGMTQP